MNIREEIKGIIPTTKYNTSCIFIKVDSRSNNRTHAIEGAKKRKLERLRFNF